MGCLWERSCSNCKHMESAVTIGVCDATEHTIERYGDVDFADNCEYYSNRYGYDSTNIREKVV